MLSLVIWWSSILFESLILFRGIRGKTLRRYPFFYAYISCVLFKSVWLYFIYESSMDLYRVWYWRTDILTLIAGCGLVLEAVEHVLSPYPGAERFARIAGLATFGVIFSFILTYPWIIPGASLAGTMVELERDLRGVQAIFLFGILVLVFHYGIAMGRNMKGMILGYGLYVGANLMMLATHHYAASFYGISKIVQPLSWNVCLLVWVSALWSYYPSPAPRPTVRLEEDYEVFASRTRNTVGAMRSYLVRVPRP